MSMEYIRRHYRTPAKRGGRIAYGGDGELRFGTITGSDGAHLRIKLDVPSMKRLEAAGLARNTHRDYWSATEAGCRAIGLDAKTIKKVFSRG